jgi:PiT family inorganic phosphate transporter
MSDISMDPAMAGGELKRPRLDHDQGLGTILLFVGLMTVGLLYVGYSLYVDVSETGTAVRTFLPFLLLGVALIIALGFEFVNGFHDTANAVATVIYTHSMPANLAVVWSGFFNFLGVLLSSGAVAFGIISLLPVELILQVGSSAGFAMVFALLIAAILWNLGTWYLGLPASSSHTLIGSIIGVGVANSLLHGGDGTSGVDWSKATEIGYSLLLSPVFGFCMAGLLFLAMKTFIRVEKLYKEPVGNAPPPWWIRLLLIGTCTGVSFAHGSNDGQKGMGLIMLILIGTVPTAYALNRSVPENAVIEFKAVAELAQRALDAAAKGTAAPAAPRAEVTRFIKERTATPVTLAALSALAGEITKDVTSYGSLKKVPVEAVSNVRNDMYLASEAIRFLGKQSVVSLDADTTKALGAFKQHLDDSTKFIPLWVKVAVAIALGLGTMVGWKRIVITVGEKIGKAHMTYAQGASAELVAAGTIFAADVYGLPVSTTHVLSSGVAGTMAANGSGLQMSTVRNLLMAWVLTLPAATMLSGILYVVFATLFA